MQTTPLSPPVPPRALGRVAAGVVLAYLLVTLYGYYNFTLANFLTSVILTPAMFLLGGAALSQRGKLRQADMLLLFLYVLWIAVDTLLIYRYTMYAYQDTIYYVGAFALGCYPMASLMDERERGPAVRGIFHVLTALVLVVCVLGLVVVIFQLHFTTSTGQLMGIPESEATGGSRLNLFGVHGNYYAPILCMLLLMSVYMILTYKNPFVRGYYALTAVIFYLTLPLSDSRANMIATAVGLGLLSLLLVWQRAHRLRNVPAAALGIVVAAAVTVGAFLGFSLALRGIEAVTIARAAAEAPQATQAAQEAPQAQEGADIRITQSRDLGRDVATLTGRTNIWREAFETAAQKPVTFLTGVTNHHTYELIPSFPQFEGRLHSSFLQVLFGFGAPALLLLLAFLLLLGRTCWGLFFGRGKHVPLGDRFLPAVLACCLLIAAIESFFFLESKGLYSPLFFLLAGYVMCVGRAQKRA